MALSSLQPLPPIPPLLPPLSLTPPTSLTIIHHLITLKLTSDNFLLRKTQKCSSFEKPAPLWLDVTAPPPPQVITFVAVGGTQTLQNPEF